MAGYAGLNWFGMELEPRFVELGNRNLELHGPKWLALDQANLVTLVQGDSRRFASLVGCDGIVTNPPYAESRLNAHYGTTPGQIGSLPAGKLDAVVTSPPFEDSLNSKDRDFNDVSRPGRSDQCSEYGQSAGQIGITTGETYWQAVKTVYEQCRLAMKPGGIMAMVVKDYVKAGKRVPLCDQTCSLLESIGFEVFERCRAWLVKEETNPRLFGEVTEKTELKSFFRPTGREERLPADRFRRGNLGSFHVEPRQKKRPPGLSAMTAFILKHTPHTLRERRSGIISGFPSLLDALFLGYQARRRTFRHPLPIAKRYLQPYFPLNPPRLVSAGPVFRPILSPGSWLSNS